MSPIIRLLVHAQLAAVRFAHQLERRCRQSHRLAAATSQRGQATAEYALVLLGAAAVALLFTAWAAKSGAIGKLFDAVVGQLIDKAG